MEKYSHYNYPFFRISQDMPYISSRKYAILKNILRTKYTIDRCRQLWVRGFEVKKCYVPHYNGIGGMTYMPNLNEIRIIVGRPTNHEPRQVYAVIIRPITAMNEKLEKGFTL